MIYSSLKKALYGALIAGLLFWWDMYGALGCWGFKPNPYDSCVMNKTVDKKQCKIFWHVDDLNISNVIPKVVDGVLSQLTAKYEKVSALSVSLGCVHDYLGMRIDYDTIVKVRITMPKHIKRILESAAEDMDSIA